MLAFIDFQPEVSSMACSMAKTRMKRGLVVDIGRRWRNMAEAAIISLHGKAESDGEIGHIGPYTYSIRISTVMSVLPIKLMKLQSCNLDSPFVTESQ